MLSTDSGDGRVRSYGGESHTYDEVLNVFCVEVSLLISGDLWFDFFYFTELPHATSTGGREIRCNEVADDEDDSKRLTRGFCVDNAK